LGLGRGCHGRRRGAGRLVAVLARHDRLNLKVPLPEHIL
jgi:hypothetical protein